MFDNKAMDCRIIGGAGVLAHGGAGGAKGEVVLIMAFFGLLRIQPFLHLYQIQ